MNGLSRNLFWKALLTFTGGSWMGWNGRTLAQVWGYWLAFYPLTAIATALGQPW
jgi:hypothetical protein